MPLPDGFIFSSNNLQDYLECQRRFQLRSMDHLVWPAVQVEPIKEYEHMVEQDAKLHKILHQHSNGVSEEQISQSIQYNEELQIWWKNYLSSLKDGTLRMISQSDNLRFREITLFASIGEFRLVAKYDLILIQANGKSVIIEWMTGKKHPDRSVLEEILYTRIAPFVLVGASPNLLRGKSISPDELELVYWFANQPDQTERFPYTQSKYQEDSKYLTDLISAINQKSDPVFPLTSNIERCRFCSYRSFCDRGTRPGEFKDWMDWLVAGTSDADIPDFDQVSEIEQ